MATVGLRQEFGTKNVCFIFDRLSYFKEQLTHRNITGELAQYGRENLERAEEWKFRSAELFMKWLEGTKFIAVGVYRTCADAIHDP